MNNSMTPEMPERVFERAAELFALLSTPTRLRIVVALCEGEKQVSELLSRIEVSQPNISQHLGTLYRGGVLARRRAGAQIFYRVVSAQAQMLSDVVCAERGLRDAPSRQARGASASGRNQHRETQ
jgi:DNA-binding transcriptional ArsR family regulator